MNEQERTARQGDPRGSQARPRADRLRALCQAADVPITPSDPLRHRVAELASRHDAQGTPSVVARFSARIAWRPAAATGATLLLILAGLALSSSLPSGSHFHAHLRRLLNRQEELASGSAALDRLAPRSQDAAQERHSHWQATLPRFQDEPRKERESGGARERASRVPSGRKAERAMQPQGSRPNTQHLAPNTQHPSSDDLAYLNADRAGTARPSAALSRDEWERIEQRVRRTIQTHDDFVTLPFPRIASRSDAQIAAAVASYRQEAAIVNPRLSREVTVAQKATALSDLCEHLRAASGVRLEAGRSVADEKVTVFCEKLPLRDVMRQLGRPFNYTWLRSGKEGDYRYELVQDLRSQLLEEELRNRDRNAALLALDREMERYRPYLALSPDEAFARAKSAAPADKKLLEKLGRDGWGPIQIYFRLSRDELATLRSGQRLTFRQEPKQGEQPLPPAIARSVLQSLRDMRVTISGEGIRATSDPKNVEGRLVATIPEARAVVTLSLDQSDLGRFRLHGSAGFKLSVGSNDTESVNGNEIAEAVSPAVGNPQNAVANAQLARDPSLQRRVTMSGVQAFGRSGVQDGSDQRPGPPARATNDQRPRPPTPERLNARTPERLNAAEEVTSADVLEALHRATGLPLAADFYTRLYPAASLAVVEQPLFEALNRIADTLRARWTKDGEWLQFRSTSFYDDRVKEVPNRLLAGWAASRREHGALTLDDLMEIVQLSDAQLAARDMAKGARVLWGLEEWGLARNQALQTHLRFLSTLTLGQRQAALSAAGLPFTRMSLAQQQQYIALAAGPQRDAVKSLDELANAMLRVEYTLPGAFEWRSPRPSSGSDSFSSARAPTREAALQAALRIDARAETAQIVPTELAVSFRFAMKSSQNGEFTRTVRATPNGTSNSANRNTDDDGDKASAGAGGNRPRTQP